MKIFALLLGSSLLLMAQAPGPPAAVELPQIRTSITISGTIEAETPASVTVLGARQIQEQPGVNIDDRLRSVPGFTLFRRASSLVANPTTQGVSLRGLGSSGASRTLVLWDSIPLNDPFGGWIYWTRLDPNELDRIEVSRGASTSIFGDRAMSGTIATFTRTPEENFRLVAGYEVGNRGTHYANVGVSRLWSRWAASMRLRGHTTDGYFIIPEARRGSVDTPAAARFVAGDSRIDFLGSAQKFFLKLDILAETRDNGTRLTENTTSLGTLAGHYLREGSQNSFSALAYHTREVYRASFSSVTATRNSESITFLQTVPSTAVGAAATWKRSADLWSVIAGGDAQRVEGTSTDRLASGALRVGGGSQRQGGAFVQLAGGRRDNAQIFAGARQQFTSGGSEFFSPSGGFLLGRRWVRVRGTVYRAFRAPTLNELYRDFRAGNAETRSNPGLQPETMFGSEVGADLRTRFGRLSTTFFRHDLSDLITNVTLSTTPQLITRQRQNAGAAIARGVEANWHMPILEHLSAELAYLYADSRFSTGERIPQVPRHSGSAQVTWFREGTLVSGGLRAYSSQFEDDRNQFLLPGFATLQIAVRQKIRSNLSATIALDNMLDREYAVGITAPAAAGLSPLVSIGSPRLWRAGLRWDGPLR